MQRTLPVTKAVLVLRVVSDFAYNVEERKKLTWNSVRQAAKCLDAEASSFDTRFPPREYYPPSDPNGYEEWRANMRATKCEEEKDLDIPDGALIESADAGDWSDEPDDEQDGHEDETAKPIKIPYHYN